MLRVSNFIFPSHALGGVRTHNLRLRRPTRYPIAPRAREKGKHSNTWLSFPMSFLVGPQTDLPSCHFLSQEALGRFREPFRIVGGGEVALAVLSESGVHFRMPVEPIGQSLGHQLPLREHLDPFRYDFPDPVVEQRVVGAT